MPILPNANQACIPREKLTDYVLNPMHPVGKHKAKVFFSVLNLTADDAEALEKVILRAVLHAEAKPTRFDEYGQRFEVEVTFERNERNVVILTAWIIETGTDIPRLTSCYIK